MYWRVRVKVQEEKNVNLQVIEKRLLDAEIEDSTLSKEQAKEMKQKAIEEQKEVVAKGKELQDIEVLDINSIIVEGNDNKARRI